MKIVKMKRLYDNGKLPVIRITYKTSKGEERERDTINSIEGEFKYWEWLDSGVTVPSFMQDEITNFYKSLESQI